MISEALGKSGKERPAGRSFVLGPVPFFLASGRRNKVRMAGNLRMLMRPAHANIEDQKANNATRQLARPYRMWF